jgi:hypothetical protein
MIRKQIVMDPELDERVARLAEARGVSQSELIRQAVDEYLARLLEEDARQRAFAELMEMFHNAPDLGLTDEQGNRTWTRESLYEDRFRRY